MKRYPEYKASSVEWIGEIPVHWEVKRIKHLASLISKGTTPTTIGREILDEGEIRFIKGENIVDNQIELKPEYYIDEETNQMLKRSQLKEDDLLFVIAGTIGKVGFVRSNHLPANTNQAISFIRPYEKESPKFIYYWLQSDNMQKITWLEVVQSAQPNLSMENLGNLYIPYPNITEQRAIIDFLDCKTGQIDELIRIKERQVELLQEQRTALINQAVTEGLDPTVEMKPSGVEWIGEIPVHWEVKRIKHLTSLISKGTTPTTIGREILDEGEIRFIKAENIVDNQIELKPEYYIDEETNQMLQRSQLKENDLLFVIAGATIGKVSLVKSNHLPANTNQAVSFIRPHEKEFSDFIYYWLRADNIQKIIWLKAVQSAQPNLSMEDLGNLYIPYPSITEQHRIVECIANKTQTIVNLLQQAYKQIELLKEYRQSLISEAVTGKIDVRNEA